MNYCKYIDIAIAELESPTLEVTKQYLEVCELEYHNGKPVVERIDLVDSVCYLYFRIENERYFILVIIELNPELRLYFVEVANAHRVYLRASSKQKSFNELSSYLNLSPLKGWSIGERKNFRNKEHDHSCIKYEPITNEAYSLEEKLSLLLNDLETDKNGVLNLTKNSKTYIAVCKYQYVSGNAGVNFSAETIKRLSILNLSIDIDTYIVGNRIK